MSKDNTHKALKYVLKKTIKQPLALAEPGPPEPGYLLGEICNRNGCQGIIKEFESDGCCSCHMGHAPCSYCVDPREYCPVCDWDAEEENSLY